jgi:hypothetical protein
MVTPIDIIEDCLFTGLTVMYFMRGDRKWGYAMAVFTLFGIAQDIYHLTVSK